jgi:hypothetical protein
MIELISILGPLLSPCHREVVHATCQPVAADPMVRNLWQRKDIRAAVARQQRRAAHVPCPALGSLPISEHVAAPPDPSCHSTRTPRPWSAPWWAAATRSRRAPRGPPLLGQRVTNVDKTSLPGCPRESPLCPYARPSACPHAPGHAGGGSSGLWGVSRAWSAGTDYAKDHFLSPCQGRQPLLCRSGKDPSSVSGTGLLT